MRTAEQPAQRVTRSIDCAPVGVGEGTDSSRRIVRGRGTAPRFAACASAASHCPHAAGASPRELLLDAAKVRRGDAGAETFEVMHALWNSPLGASPTVRLARPLAYHPELGVLLQGGVPGDATLKEIVETTFDDAERAGLDRVRRLLRRTARGLAELHACGVTRGHARGWEEERDEVRGAG